MQKNGHISTLKVGAYNFHGTYRERTNFILNTILNMSYQNEFISFRNQLITVMLPHEQFLFFQLIKLTGPLLILEAPHIVYCRKGRKLA